MLRLIFSEDFVRILCCWKRARVFACIARSSHPTINNKERTPKSRWLECDDKKYCFGFASISILYGLVSVSFPPPGIRCDRPNQSQLTNNCCRHTTKVAFASFRSIEIKFYQAEQTDTIDFITISIPSHYSMRRNIILYSFSLSLSSWVDEYIVVSFAK